MRNLACVGLATGLVYLGRTHATRFCATAKIRIGRQMLALLLVIFFNDSSWVQNR